MSGFGAKLREARKQQGISLETVENETKIRKLYLAAMEEENFSILPPQVYALGFVKRYADFLGLDPDALSQEFKKLAYPVTMEEVQMQPVKPQIGLRLRRLPLKKIAAAAVFLVLVIWSGNYFAGYLSDYMNRPKPTQPSQLENKNPVQPSNPTPSTQETGDLLKVQLKAKAGQSCWTLVKVDGEQKVQETFSDGQQQTFTARDSIFVRLGNAAAMDIFVNNKQIEPLGGPGEVQEKEFKNGDK